MSVLILTRATLRQTVHTCFSSIRFWLCSQLSTYNLASNPCATLSSYSSLEHLSH